MVKFREETSINRSVELNQLSVYINKTLDIIMFFLHICYDQITKLTLHPILFYRIDTK